MTPSERAELLAAWAQTEEPAETPQPKSREEAIAEWGTSPEAEAGLARFIAEEGLVTA